MPGFVHTAYKYILLLILAVARLDGSALTGRLQPLRGTFEEGWMQAVCRGLEDLGAFISPAKSFEALVLGAIRVVAAEAIFPAWLLITAADFVENLTWLPGHF